MMVAFGADLQARKGSNEVGTVASRTPTNNCEDAPSTANHSHKAQSGSRKIKITILLHTMRSMCRAIWLHYWRRSPRNDEEKVRSEAESSPDPEHGAWLYDFRWYRCGVYFVTLTVIAAQSTETPVFPKAYNQPANAARTWYGSNDLSTLCNQIFHNYHNLNVIGFVRSQGFDSMTHWRMLVTRD